MLAISTDPAHSLGDAVGARLTSRPAAVPLTRGCRGQFEAVELDAARAFARWLRQHRRALGEVIEHGTWLDRSDVDTLLGLSVPGIDELGGLLEIARLAASPGKYDLVVVDTAPTGHTLRLIAAPAAVGAVADVLDSLQEQHRIIRDQLARVGRPEAADRLVALIADQAKNTADVLHDPARTSFVWITLPEDLSLAESEDAIRALDGSGVRVSTVIVNRVLPHGGRCRLCDARRAQERRVIARVRRTIGKGRRIDLEAERPPGTASIPRAAAAASTSARHGLEQGFMEARGAAVFGRARLLFFGGKGGVGKTTVAAAAALALARGNPSRPIVIISMDPAHSLGDVLRARLGDVPARIRGAPANLSARELDAGAALADRRATLEKAVEDVAATFGAGRLSAGGFRGVSELMDLAPPGVDELFGLVEMARLARSARDHVFVVDTAPTGHALRLLEMPEVAREWLQVLLRVLLKYRELVRPGQLAAELLDLSQSVRALQRLLGDPVQTRFIVVARAAALPRLETERLVARLRALKLGVPALVVNALTVEPGRCPWCRTVARAERRELAALAAVCRRRRAGCVIIRTPLTMPPPRGVPALERWAETWMG